METKPAALHSLICPVLIGRTSQLESILHFIEQACAGLGHTVLLAGEAGIGKSRLVREAMALLRSPQSLVPFPTILTLQGRCFEQDSSVPYAPLRDMVRPFFASRSEMPRTLSPFPMAAELVKLLPEFAPQVHQSVPSFAFEPELEKRRLHQALLTLFEHLSASSPLLLIVEDVHWSDDSSLEFLLFLARRIASHPILLLLTYRSEEEPPCLTRFLTELNRTRLSTELQLSHLSRTEVGAMLHATLVQEGSVRADLLETVYTLTEGSPFFIEEFLKSLITAGTLVLVEGRWEYRPPEGKVSRDSLRLPRSVQLAVQQRLDHLSSEARELLSLAAVAGRHFDFPLLQQITRREEAELIPLVKELVTAQLVVEESEDLFVFRHALTRQAVYTDLLARERRTLHRLLAETLEHMNADALDSHLDDLAYHSYAAKEWRKVLSYAKRAGDRAKKLFATHVAIEEYTHALEAARQLGQLPSLSLYRARGQCYELLGDFTSACDDYIQALEGARTAQDSHQEWQSLFDLGYLWTGRDYERAGNYLHQALSLARTMNDQLTLARTLNRVGNWYANMEEPQKGLQYHQEALDIFQGLADQRGLAETYDLVAIARYNTGGPVTAIAYYEQAIALWRVLGDHQGLVSSLTMMTVRSTNYLNLAGVWVLASRTECLRDGEEALAIARQLGWPSAEALALIFLGIGLGPRGEYVRALTCAQAGLKIATEIEHEPWMGFGHLLLGILALDLLALPTARKHLEQALSLAKKMSYTFLLRVANAFLASVCVAEQDVARAEAILEPEFSFHAPPQTAVQRLIWYAQTELELGRSRADAALEIVDSIIASAAFGDSGGVIPHVWHMRARALIALNRPKEAEATLLEAQACAHAHEARPILWRLCIALGKLYRTRGQREQAEVQYAEARTIIEQLAAGLEDEMVRGTFLQFATAQLPPLPRPSLRRAARQAFGGLTQREREVAALIAEGKSNRVLAEKLVISERTIGTHVENILSKLGFTSRAQIAVWAVEKGLVKK